MAISLIKPELFNVPNTEVLAEFTFDQYTVKQFGVSLPLPITVASMSSVQEGKKAEINLADMNNPALHDYYYSIKTMTLHCGWLGEILFERIKTLNDYKTNSSAELITAFIKKKNEKAVAPITYERLDFMAHKDLLCELLKEAQGKSELPFDRKAFCTLLNDLIIQRNAFVHGKLMLFQKGQGYETVLHSTMGYQLLNMTVFNSFCECFQELALHISSVLKIFSAE